MSRQRHSYVCFYPGDWIGGTALLNRLQRSLLFDVCVYNWDKAEPMPRAVQAVAFADVEDADKQIDLLVKMGKLRRTRGGGLVSDRAVIEARSSSDRWTMLSESGKRGAEKRWKNKDKDNHANGDAIAHSMHNQNQNHIQNHNIPPKPPKGGECVVDGQGEEPAQLGEAYSTPFESWWADYPNKTGKRAAAKSYEAAFRRLGGAKAGSVRVHAHLRAALAAQRRVWRRKGIEGRYIPHAATWLNQSRYSDEVVIKEMSVETQRPVAEAEEVLMPPDPLPNRPPCPECGAAYDAMHVEGCSREPRPKGWVPGEKEGADRGD